MTQKKDQLVKKLELFFEGFEHPNWCVYVSNNLTVCGPKFYVNKCLEVYYKGMTDSHFNISKLIMYAVSQGFKDDSE